MSEIDLILRWAFIGTVVVLFPLWIPIALVAIALILIGYCCEKFYGWLEKAVKP